MNIEGDGNSADPLNIQIDNNGGGGLTFGGSINNQGSAINVIGSASSAATVTFGGIMSGAGGFYKENANITVLMTAANTYNGQTTIQSGTLRLAGSGSLANSAVRLHSGGTLSISNNATVGSVAEFASGNAGVIAISNGATLTINSIENGLFQNSISGAGNLTFSGTGSLGLYGTQSYAGTTTVSNGQLSTGVAMSSTNFSLTGGTFRTTAANVISDTAAVTLSGGALSIGGAETFGNNGVTLAPSTSSTISVDSGITASVSGAVTGSGNISKSGSGQLNLSGNNNYTGTTTVSGGSLEVQSDNALGNASAGTTVNSGAELRMWNASGVTVGAEALTLNGAGIGDAGALRSVSGNNTWQGVISNASGARINSDAGTLTIAGTINSGTNNLYLGGTGNITIGGLVNGTQTTGNGALYKDGSGVLTLTNNNTGLTGLVRLLGGTISITNNNSLGTGALELGGLGTQAVLQVGTNTSRSQTLLIQNNSTNSIINVASGSTFTATGSLTQDGTPANTTKFGKDGAGTLILAGASGNNYNGQIQIGNGTVIAGTSTALGANTSTSARGIDLGLNISDTEMGNSVALLASNGVTVGQSIYVAPNISSALRTVGLAGSGSVTFTNEIFLGGNLTVNAGAAGTDQVTISGAIVNTNGVTKTGAGSLLLSGANTYTGQTTVSGGTLVLTNGSALADTGVLQLDNTAGVSATVAQSETIGSLRGGGTTGGNISIASGATLTVAETTTQNYAGAISGNGSLTKSGAGQLNLSGASSYSGLTTISSGSLEAQSAAALGSTNGATTVNSGANLKLYGGGSGISYDAEAITLNGFGPAYGDVGGDAGALRSVGGGTNTWNGAITLGSSARINSDAAGGAGSLTIAGNISGGANVLFVGTKSSAVANMTISGALSGAGAVQDGTITSLFKDGASTLTLSGNNNYSGDTRISAGNLTVASGGNLGNGTSDIFIANGGSLTINANATVASLREWGTTNGGTATIGSGATLTVSGDAWSGFMNSIGGAGNLTKSGTGTMNLYGTQGYTGTTTVSGGLLSSDVALTSSNIVISGGTFAAMGTNIIANTATVNMSSGTFALQGSDTVKSLSVSGGLLSTTNNSVLTTTDTTASSVTVTGGTIGASIVSGGGVNVSSGSTTLNGKITAASGSALSVGGQLTTGGTDNIGDTTAVNLGSTGTLTLGGNETVGFFQSFGNGSLLGTGNKLQGTGYSLNGGTISANLGTGNLAVNTAGSTTTLNGTSDSTSVIIWDGSLLLGANERLNNSANLSVQGGLLNLQTFNETVNTVSLTNGATISGSGILTATSYALQGGTVNANLGTGTINATTNSTTLNGTSAADTVNVSGGLLALGAADRLANSAAVNVSSGTLDTATFNDTVGSLTTTGGTVSGSGTITAANYNLNGGTINANLGTGTLTASNGTTALNGIAAATTVTVSGGTLNTSGANKLADSATVAVTSGTLGVGGNDTVGSVAISSSGTVSVATNSTLTATANSTISGTGKATGGTLAVANNANLNLSNDAKTTTSDLSIGSGSKLAGTGGTTGKISGGGLLSPGNSPGILTAGQVDVSNGMDFAFEFTGAGAPTYSLAGNSRNDLLHLTNGSSPFVGSFSTANNLSFYFNDSSLLGNLAAINPTTYLGGFYVDSLNFDIAALLSAATKSYYVFDANGTDASLNGQNYRLLSQDVTSRVIFGNINQSNSNFDTGTTNGTVLSVTMVPEPSSASLLTFALSGLLALRRRRA